jgi:hypothetical protein
MVPRLFLFWLHYSIIIDAYACFEYTSRGFILHFVGEGAVVLFEAVNCCLIPKIFCGVLKCNLLLGQF